MSDVPLLTHVSGESGQEMTLEGLAKEPKKTSARSFRNQPSAKSLNSMRTNGMRKGVSKNEFLPKVHSATGKAESRPRPVTLELSEQALLNKLSTCSLLPPHKSAQRQYDEKNSINQREKKKSERRKKIRIFCCTFTCIMRDEDSLNELELQ